MTALTVFQEVCPVIGLAVPNAVMASTDREHLELGALANEMATRIARAHEWQILNTVETITGDGTTLDWALPDDYDRMLTKSQVWSSALSSALTPIPDADHWLGLDVQAFDFVLNAWIIYGGQIHIKPALATDVTAKFFYQSNLIVDAASGPNATTFVADGDTFRLSERLLKLGMIWQWKANKGQAYAEHMATYEEELSRLATRDRGSYMLKIGRRRWPRDTKVAYPQNIVV
jgi:hypothetical protein